MPHTPLSYHTRPLLLLARRPIGFSALAPGAQLKGGDSADTSTELAAFLQSIEGSCRPGAQPAELPDMPKGKCNCRRDVHLQWHRVSVAVTEDVFGL